MPSPHAGKPRLAYIDWMRGLACVLMFQTHCYDSWLSPAARQTDFFMYSQLGGTFPAPLFLFLAGISFALVTEKLRQKNLAASQIARTTIRRGAEIFALGLLFRLQEYVVAWGWAPKSDLLRVDILNTIGVSMMLMGVACWIATSLPTSIAGSDDRKNTSGQPPLRQAEGKLPAVRPGSARLAWFAAGTALLISIATPLLWTTWRPAWLPWPIEYYVDGVQKLGAPSPGLFPIFPWTGFAFAGLAVGFILQSDWARARQARVFFLLGGVGILLVELARLLDRQPRQLYAAYDYWHTSPNFFVIRVGMLLMILCAAYAWCRWVIGRLGTAQWGFSPLIQLGRASLLVYWVHIEFVYGRVSILPKHADSIRTASVGLLVITLAMLALAYIRTRTKGRGAEVMAWLTHTPART